jgi:hypothetical protein
VFLRTLLLALVLSYSTSQPVSKVTLPLTLFSSIYSLEDGCSDTEIPLYIKSLHIVAFFVLSVMTMRSKAVALGQLGGDGLSMETQA